MKIGITNYINALPFTLFLPKELPFELIFDHPSNLNRKLEKGELDCSLISSYAYLRGNYKTASLGVVAKEEVLSVNLYVSDTIDDLEGVEVGVTLESATSVELLKLLFANFWKVNPKFVPLKSGQKAFLLIGDSALISFELEGFRRIDLATCWHYLTNLPFTFAVFASKDEAKLSEVTPFFKESITEAEKQRSQLIEAAQKEIPISPPFLDAYYNCLKYNLEQPEFTALQLFDDCLLGKTPLELAHERSRSHPKDVWLYRHKLR